MEIKPTIQAAIIMAGIGLLLLVVTGIRTIRAGQKLPFFQKRRMRVVEGWRLILFGFLLGILALLLNRYGEPVAYRYFPPSPTVTNTPTITLTPTITNTLENTLTSTITPTLDKTYTPMIPTVILTQFASSPIPNENAVFSSLQFCTKLNNGLPVNPTTLFKLPLTKLYGVFSFDKMTTGTQWTQVWLRGSEILYFESKPWEYAPGGYGYADCPVCEGNWTPGEYEVQIFAGLTWKASGTFTIEGDAPLATSTPTITVTPAAPASGTTVTPSPPGTPNLP